MSTMKLDIKENDKIFEDMFKESYKNLYDTKSKNNRLAPFTYTMKQMKSTMCSPPSSNPEIAWQTSSDFKKPRSKLSMDEKNT